MIRGRDRLLGRGRCAGEHWIAHDSALMAARVRLTAGVECPIASDPVGPAAPIVLLCGVLHNERELRSEAAGASPAAGTRQPGALDDVLTRLYPRHGDDFIVETRR